MDNEAIRERCAGVLKDFLVQDGAFEAVLNGGPLLEGSALDSLGMVNLVVALEKEFAIRMPTEDLETTFATLDNLVAELSRHVAG